MGQKLWEGFCSFLGRGAVLPYNTMSLGSRPTLLPSGILNSSSHLAKTNMGRKLGGAVALWEGGPGSPSKRMWPGTRPTCMPSFTWIHPTFGHHTPTSKTEHDRQRDRQSSIAYDEPFYIWSPNKLMIVMLNIKNLVETLYKVTGYSGTLAY